MAWSVRLPDGSMSKSFDTRAEAEAFADTIDEHHGRTPEEIWDSETRPRVKRDVFLSRMARGWKPHRALHTTIDGQYQGLDRASASVHLDTLIGGRNAALHEVMGRSRTIAQWAVTSGVSESRIRKGIAKHGSLQKYFLNIGWYPFKPAEPGDPAVFDDRWTSPTD